MVWERDTMNTFDRDVLTMVVYTGSVGMSLLNVFLLGTQDKYHVQHHARLLWDGCLLQALYKLQTINL